jgi:glutaminyl-tRNA synthetase
MHWVATATAVQAEVRLYERLFNSPNPSAGGADPLEDLNPDSVKIIAQAQLEPALADTPLGGVVQFERIGYFAHDLDRPMIFHRTVGLRDEWARIQKRNG